MTATGTPPQSAVTLEAENQILFKTIHLANDLKQSFNTKSFRPEDLTGYRNWILYMLEKSQTMANSIHLLATNNFMEESALLLRTFFEFYISFRLIVKNPKYLHRYADFLYVMRKRRRDLLKKHGLLESSGFNDDLTNEDIDRSFRRVKREHNFVGSEMFWFPYDPKKENNPSLKQACRHVGELEFYDIIYQALSDYAHADILSLVNYDFVVTKGEGKIDLVRRSQDFSGIPSTAAFFLLFVEKRFNEEFKLNNQSQIQDLLKEHKKIKDQLVWKI